MSIANALNNAISGLTAAARGTEVVGGRTLDELVPSPRYPAAWENAFNEIVPMPATARSPSDTRCRR